MTPNFFPEMVKEREFSSSTFFFKRNMDIYLYFHSPGTELWLTYYAFPFSVTSERDHPYITSAKGLGGCRDAARSENLERGDL